jgi:G:T-mismatch repair DNA endonuclease (very short patch repair protein)
MVHRRVHPGEALRGDVARSVERHETGAGGAEGVARDRLPLSAAPRDLPNKPDVVVPKYRTALFVHGCFWHRHPGCAKARLPKNNADFWREKLQGNVERDERPLFLPLFTNVVEGLFSEVTM